jgi:Skp family chaperone for outer membrane proteins
VTPTRKIATAAVAGVLGLAVTGAAAFAAFQPSEPAPATAAIDTGTAAPQVDREGARDRIKDVLDKLVKDQTITQQQEDAILKAFKDAAGKGPDGDKDGRKVIATVLRDLMKTSADYLGLPPGQLKQQLAAGKSLGQIADANPPKSRQGLIDALTTDVTAKIDKLQADGKITADQAAKIKAELPTRIAKFVDHTFKAKTGKPTT